MSHSVDPSEKTKLGFWIYLMTDCVVFASFFATYAVIKGSTDGGPTSDELFSLSYVLVETMLLLVSSLTAGIAVLAYKNKRLKLFRKLIITTLLLGGAFIAMELYEFAKLAHEGHNWQASAFLSGYFSLVGLHGLHIIAGLIWGTALILGSRKKHLHPNYGTRLELWSMFWHFLDIVWIFIFTFVYLIGAQV